MLPKYNVIYVQITKFFDRPKIKEITNNSNRENQSLEH